MLILRAIHIDATKADLFVRDLHGIVCCYVDFYEKHKTKFDMLEMLSNEIVYGFKDNVISIIKKENESNTLNAVDLFQMLLICNFFENKVKKKYKLSYFMCVTNTHTHTQTNKHT